MGAALALLGLILMVVGSIWLFLEGLKESLLWALGMLVFQIVVILFIIWHWETAKRPFLLWLGGWVLIALGVALSPHR